MRFRPKTTDSTSLWLPKSIQKNCEPLNQNCFLFLLGKRIAVFHFCLTKHQSTIFRTFPRNVPHWNSCLQQDNHLKMVLPKAKYAVAPDKSSQCLWHQRLVSPQNKPNPLTSRSRLKCSKKQTHQYLQRRYHRP